MRHCAMGYLPAALVAAIATSLIFEAIALDPYAAEQNLQGDIFAPPHSNVVMQSVVLGHGQQTPEILEDPDDDYDFYLWRFMKRLLGKRQFICPLTCKKTELDELDSETLDTETLEKMMSAVQKARKRRKKKATMMEERDIDDGLDLERLDRLVDWEREIERPRRYDRLRKMGKHVYGDNGRYWKRRGFGRGEDEDDSGRRSISARNNHRRRNWDVLEDHLKSRETEPRDLLYLPPKCPHSKHLLSPISTDDYIK